MDEKLHQLTTNLLEYMAYTTEYLWLVVIGFVIAFMLAFKLALSTKIKLHKPSANTSTQTMINTNDYIIGVDEEPLNTYYGNGEIDFETEKQKPYVIAVLNNCDDVTDQELKCAMKYLQRKMVTEVDAVSFFSTISYLKSIDHNMKDDVKSAGLGQRCEAASHREQLIKILIESGYGDAEDIFHRYEKTRHCSIQTKEEFIDFYEDLRGIGDLEKKLAKEKLVAEQEKRKAEQEKRKAEMKDQQIEEEKRKAEQEKRKAEMKDQQIEMKDQQIEEEKRKVLALEIQAQRSLCKLCLHEEVGMLCRSCNQMYFCSQCADVVRQHRHCYICKKQ